MKRAVHPRLGSTLRLSQPLSGFLASQSFAALFRAATVPGTSLQSVPLVRIASVSRRRLAPLSLSTHLPWRTAFALSPLVSPTPTLSRDCLVPPATMNSLSTCPKTRFPVALDSRSKTALYGELHRLRSLPPLTSPFSNSSGCPSPPADTLLGFFPSKVFSDCVSKPRPAQASGT
jgi:hypothetical protein